ncbi:Phytochrome-like protein cph1 [Rubripirellula obstinata]|uniref:histidine kinase n=1 Tax=Rubripirellula obstinata TaxID=406547 RepID=A0A5B1CII0_9BACT|nr:ATP-binding protein [Rubripirellula obstinata]KAA1259410.1 Phytochrome-like protein cph1 [Rubripirellula obstinata]
MPNAPIKKSLRRRIYMACCLLVGLCIVSTIIGRAGQTQLLRNFAAYESSEETLAQVANLDQDVQELKSRSEKYLQTGAPSQLARAMDLQKALSLQISEVNDKNEDPRIRANLIEMRSELDVFKDRLSRAADERELRTRLIQQDLPNKHRSISELLEEILRVMNDQEEGFMAVEYFRLVHAHDQSLQFLQRYFIEPDAAAFEKALSSIDLARSLIKQIVKSADEAEIQQLGQQLDQELSEFRKTGSRAVQATRSYMFYSNVVMAGEISEFVYDSNRLKKYVEEQRIQSRELRNQSAERSLWLALLASITAVAVAVVMATRLSYMIVTPISRLTETFRRLGQGESVDGIPAMDRFDEIGRMARAAKIFSDKNKETQQLLQRSEQLSNELANKAEALEQTNMELDNFAYVASHDLKSPLRGITHLASWVQEDCESLLPDDSRNHLQQMKDRVAKMESLLDDLLDYSRAGRINPKPEKIDVGELVASVVSMIDLPDGFRVNLMTPTFDIFTVRTPLFQSLMNLVTNGVKYNDKGKDGKLEILAERTGDFVHFRVRDNGPGIDPKFHSKVFEMYQRLESEGVEGSGMGLAIVKKLISRYGGELSLESEIGGGAEFSFTWPCAERVTDDITGKLANTASNG